MAPSPSSIAPPANRCAAACAMPMKAVRCASAISRINAAARMNGISYSVLMNGLKQRNITINRKMLADIAVNDPAAFTKLVETVKG